LIIFLPPPSSTDSQASATLVQSQWQTNPDGSQTTTNIVSLNQTYKAPQNDKVTVTFTKLPDNPGKLTITEVKLTPDQQKAASAFSDTAYNITSDMTDGTFQYDLTLPLPDQAKGKSVEVKSSETVDGLKDSSNVDQPKEVTSDIVTITGLNHFTIFVVTVIVLQPSYATPGGGGVFSAYVGPPDYDYVSPGATALYNGREAGIIKAGLNIDTDGHYEDEGLFAFTPTVTIDTFAAGTVTYDVVNEAGINPVWMTIEIDTGIAGDRADNTTYQFVPTTNPTGWHTVNAAAGLWQKWNNGAGDTTGNPLISLGAIAAAHPGINVVRAYLRLGMGDSYNNGGTGTIAWVNTATFGGNTYDFSITSVTTKAATGVTTNDATLNALNKSAATGHSFWVSLAPFVTTSSSIPSGVYSSPDLGSIAANTDFSVSLSSITTTGVPTNLPAITPDTTYYFAAWSEVGGTWYPGEISSFTTAHKYTQADFTAFDGVNIGTNSYTVSSSITATYDNGTGTESNPVLLKLTGYAPIVTPWFNSSWTTYNYVAIGIKLPVGFSGATVYQADIMRYDDLTNFPNGYYTIGYGSTPLAAEGAAFGYLNYEFAANSNNTKKDGLAKLKVTWTEGGTPEYFTIDINDLSLTDTTAPTIPVLTSPINGVFINNNAPLMQWDDSTDIGGSGVASYDYQVYYNCTNPGNIPGSCSSVTNVNSLSSSEYQAGSTGDGVYYWQVRAKDNTGNFSNWSELEKVIIDTTVPTLAITSPTTNQVIMGRTISISGTATDNNFNYYYCYVSNINGHEYGTRDASCTTTWHAVTPAALLGSVTLPNDLTDGSYVYHLIGKDKAGNATEVTKQFVLDNTAPSAPGMPSTLPNPTNSTTQIWSWTAATDTLSGVANYAWRAVLGATTINDTTTTTSIITNLAEGIWNFFVKAIDNAGNESSESSGSVTVDTTTPAAPTITSSSHTLSTWDSDRTINISWNASDFSGIAGYSYLWDLNPTTNPDTVSEGTNISTTSTNRPTSQAIYFHIRAVDGAGNWSNTTHYGPFWIDANAPTGSWITPLNNNYLRSTVNLEVSPNDVGSGIKHVVFKIKPTGGSFTTISTNVTNPYQGSLDTTTKVDGTYVLRAQIVDNVNRSVNKDINVTIDNIPPTTPVADPIGKDYDSDQIVTLASDDSGSGLKNIYYTLDGTTPDNGKTLYAGAISVNHDMTIKAIAYDNANNASSILTAVYGIAPVISGETSSSVSETTATITWTTDDLSTSRVVYDTVSHALGSAPNYGYATSTVEDGTKVTSHSVGLTGLTAGTTYFYRTVSHGSPETVSSDEQSFTTSSTTTAPSTNSGGAVDDEQSCTHRDCSGNQIGGPVATPTTQQVLGALTGPAALGLATLLPVTNVLGAEVIPGQSGEVLGQATSSATPTPTVSPTPAGQNPVSNAMDRAFGYLPILLLILLIIALIAYLIYRKKKLS
jgi:hypothetical protein